MNELLVFGELHKFIHSLGPMECTTPAKSFLLGYRHISVWGKKPRFATLNGDKKYCCLIIHVDPGNPESALGKKLQKEVQQLFNFDIKEIRNFSLKKHEIYIPLEVINSTAQLTSLKEYIKEQFELARSKQ